MKVVNTHYTPQGLNNDWPWAVEVDPEIYKHRQNWPKISIVTPSFNQGEFIEETILSVTKQNYPNLEYIIVDGGSTDGTLDIIKKYQDKITYWFSENDDGQSDAIIKGFNKTSGEIIAWINSDDWYTPNAFLYVAEAFLKNSNTKVVYGQCFLTTFDGVLSRRIVPGKVTKANLLQYWVHYSIPPQPSIFFRKSLYEVANGIDKILIYGMDYDLWLKFSDVTKFYQLHYELSCYRIHDESKTGSVGGFGKFLPEWHKIHLQHLESSSLALYIRTKIAYKIYLLDQKVKSFYGLLNRMIKV